MWSNKLIFDKFPIKYPLYSLKDQRTQRNYFKSVLNNDPNFSP